MLTQPPGMSTAATVEAGPGAASGGVPVPAEHAPAYGNGAAIYAPTGSSATLSLPGGASLTAPNSNAVSGVSGSDVSADVVREQGLTPHAALVKVGLGEDTPKDKKGGRRKGGNRHRYNNKKRSRNAKPQGSDQAQAQVQAPAPTLAAANSQAVEGATAPIIRDYKYYCVHDDTDTTRFTHNGGFVAGDSTAFVPFWPEDEESRLEVCRRLGGHLNPRYRGRTPYISVYNDLETARKVATARVMAGVTGVMVAHIQFNSTDKRRHWPVRSLARKAYFRIHPEAWEGTRNMHLVFRHIPSSFVTDIETYSPSVKPAVHPNSEAALTDKLASMGLEDNAPAASVQHLGSDLTNGNPMNLVSAPINAQTYVDTVAKAVQQQPTPEATPHTSPEAMRQVDVNAAQQPIAENAVNGTVKTNTEDVSAQPHTDVIDASVADNAQVGAGA